MFIYVCVCLFVCVCVGGDLCDGSLYVCVCEEEKVMPDLFLDKTTRG